MVFTLIGKPHFNCRPQPLSYLRAVVYLIPIVEKGGVHNDKESNRVH